MTSRGFALSWAAVLACVATTFAVLAAPPDLSVDFEEADIVFVGTSLTSHAVPRYAGPHTAVITEKTHFRVGLGAGDQREMIKLLDSAIAQKPELVVIEINPFLFDFNHQQAVRLPKDDPIAEASRLIQISRNNARERLQTLAGLRDSRIGHATRFVNAPVGSQDVSDAAKLYPLHLHDPSPDPALVERLLAAREQGVEVAFLLPPRSANGVRLIGKGTSQELQANARIFTRRAGCELIDFGTGWDDAFYIDLGHLNSVGRERFLDHFRQWYAARS